MNYIGDFAEDATVRIVLTTNNGDGAAVAPSSAFEAADFRVYKNGSATQKATTNGITISSPFDSVTGLHILEIDTSNDTGDSGFWTTGADFWVVATPDETIDSQTVVSVIATFSIQNRYSSARLAAIETDTQDIQGRLPAALVSGRIDASVGAMAANTLTASALATDAVTEIQSGLATSTQATAIEADTVDIQSRIPETLDNGLMRSSVQSMAPNVLNAAALATDAITEIVAGVFNAMPGASWDDGSFGDRLLIGANNNRSILVTGSNHAAADIHQCQTDVIDANALAADAVAEIAGAVGGGTGTGARTVTITVNDGTTPLQNAIVRLSQGVENYVGKTNVSGVIVFAVDDATWNVAITKSGYRFTPTTLVVDGTETRTYSMTARAFTPSEADKVTGYWTVLGADGEAAEGVVVTVRAIKAKSGSTGLIHVKTARTATTDSEGVAEFANMLPGWSYSVSLDGETIATVAIASDATDEVELGSCILAE